MDLDSRMQQALAVRINLQISLSTMPVVEEWMDGQLTRWLESVPLPPELPSGTLTNWRVVLASDMSRLRWSAFGHPGAFVPKMSAYLSKCGIAAADLNLINGLGEELEPDLAGSWVSVADGDLRTGWQFNEVKPMVELEPHLGMHEVSARLMAWVHASAVVNFRRFAQAIGTDPFSEIELMMPGGSIDDQVEVAATAFADFLGEPLSAHARAAMSAAATAKLSVVVRIAGSDLIGVSVIAPAVGNDVVAKLCAGSGVDYKGELRQIQGMLGAEQLHALEYRKYKGREEAMVDVHLVPGAQLRTPDLSKN